MNNRKKFALYAKQLKLFSFCSAGEIFYKKGGRILVAASVIFLCGVFVHPCLAVLLIPVSTALFFFWFWAQKTKNTGERMVPPLKISLVQGLNIWRRPRLTKYYQKSLDLY